jgi:hypothetical protein
MKRRFSAIRLPNQAWVVGLGRRRICRRFSLEIHQRPQEKLLTRAGSEQSKALSSAESQSGCRSQRIRVAPGPSRHPQNQVEPHLRGPETRLHPRTYAISLYQLAR